jgi:MFS family permease
VNFDWWLAGICLSRVFSQTVTMTYAAVVPLLQQEWGMSATAAGGIASAFQIGYAASLFVFSSLADRIGSKPLFLGSISAAAFFSLGFALFARGYLSAVILYTLVGVSLGGSYTTGLMIIADQYPVRRRGMASGWFIASSSMGYMLSLVMSGMAIPIGGYRLSFLVTCLGPALGSIFAWVTLRKTQVSVTRRQEEERFTKEVVRNRPARLLIGSYTCHCWELLGMWAWTPAFLTSCLVYGGARGLDATGSGAYLTAALHLAGLTASFSMGALSDRHGRARVIMMLSGISAFCSFVFGWTIGWPFAVVVAIGLAYSFSSLGDSPVLSAALTEVVTPSYLGAAFGVRSLLGFGAGAVSPLVFGAVLDLTNPVGATQEYYLVWGWAFSTLGVGGIGALWAAYRLEKATR